MVTSVLPMDLTHSSNSITLNGSNLNGVSFEVVSQTATSGEDSERYFPSVSFHSQDPAGTWLKLNVDASNTEILDFYTIVVWNDLDDDGDQDSDEIDEGLFRVIPDGPIVDYWSPSQTEPGKVYVVSLNGKNLQHAELIAADENRLRVSNVDNSRDNRLTALVKVLSAAAFGETDLIVRDSDDREWRVPITVSSSVTTLSTRSQSLSVSNVTADIEGLAPLYVQQFKARESFTRSLSQARSQFFGFNYSYNLVNFQWQLPMIYCDSLGEYGDFCLKDLQPGQSVDIQGFVISVYVNADLLIYWRGWPPSYPLACLRATAAFEFPGTGGFRESVNFCFGEYVFAGTSGHTASMTIGGGGSCIQVEQFRRREGAIGVVPASARVTRLGCCDDPDGAVTITASGDTFRSQTFATNFSLERAPAATASQPANCVDTTLAIDDSQNHANIVQAEGMDTTTLTVSLSEEPADPVNRYLEADFGMVPSSVMLSSDSATATYTAGTHPEGSTSTTTAATVKVLRASTDQQSLDEVTVFNYDGFDFTNLGILASDMIVSIPSSTSATALNTTVSQDAAVIQRFLEGQNSFLKDFYLDPEAKEGFYDQDGDGSFDSDDNNLDATGDILYQPRDATQDTFDRGANQLLLTAAQVIARLASCTTVEDVTTGNNIFDCRTMRSYRVMPRNMLVTMQKEQSLVAKTTYPRMMNQQLDHGKLDDAMGCSLSSVQNFIDDIACGADTFVNRYTESVARFTGKTEFFHNIARGVRHGYLCGDCTGSRCTRTYCTRKEKDDGKGPIVTFFVKNPVTETQYRYTPWVQAYRDGGGVHGFYSVWTGSRFQNVSWSTGGPR